MPLPMANAYTPGSTLGLSGMSPGVNPLPVGWPKGATPVSEKLRGDQKSSIKRDNVSVEETVKIEHRLDFSMSEV